ncbi:MAG TPA: hypothetical protein VLA03_03570, partial [Draconibacterium sp.]|nr:hypothetical protein [Draconibacterium sp.]
RYYFLNNANIWLWGLYGNKNPKGWELAGTSKNTIELGGRIQLPVKIGEAALSFHHRKTDMSALLPESSLVLDEVPDYRIGFDTKLDCIIGFWLEGTWVTKSADLGFYKNEELLNTGIDYTFGIGNGLSATFEQLLMSYDEKPFDFENTTTFSLLNISYSIGLFDNLSAIIYYNWTDNSIYNYINWHKQFNKISFYLMAYWNPDVYRIPTQSTIENLYGGKGIQLMLVFNH